MTVAASVILLAIAGALHYKHRVPRLVNWLLLIASIGAAAQIVGYFGAFKGTSIYGVGIFSVLAIVGLIFFWEEAVKRNGIHRVRTPIVAVITGVSIMSAGGTFWHDVQNDVHQSGSNVSHITDSLNGK